MPPGTPAGNAGLFSGFTRLSKLFALLVVVLYVVTKFLPSSLTYLALVPGRTIPCVWNLVTSQFLETHGALVALDVFAILFLAKIIEPIYGSKEFLKFTLTVVMMAGCAIFGCLFLAYMFGPRLGFIWYGKFCGVQAILSAYLVAIKQIMPDSELRLLFVIKLRAKYLPGLYVGATALVSSLGHGQFHWFTVGLACFGVYMAWLYLRVMQVKMDGKLVGDPSDEFRFATFFPEVVHPVIDKIVAPLSVCAGRRKMIDTSGYVLAGKPLPGSDLKESNRRRERGARALEERLASSPEDADPEAAPPSSEAPAENGNGAVPIAVK